MCKIFYEFLLLFAIDYVVVVVIVVAATYFPFWLEVFVAAYVGFVLLLNGKFEAYLVCLKLISG